METSLILGMTTPLINSESVHRALPDYFDDIKKSVTTIAENSFLGDSVSGKVQILENI